MNNKLCLYIMNKKGLSALEYIVNNNKKNRIKFVVSSKDSKMKQDYFDEIKDLCKKQSITFYEKTEALPINTNYKIAIGWKWIIKETTNLIVMHDSILPKYRGFSPLVNALINGDKEVGVTALLANNEYDTGNIIKIDKIKIKYPIKIEQAIEAISICYCNLLSYIIKHIELEQVINAKKQNHNKASYSLWRDDKDYLINWYKSAKNINRFIDSVGFPFDGAQCKIDSETIVITDALLVKDFKIVDRKQHIGKVIFIKDKKPIIVCGKGLLQITKAYNYKTNENILPFKNIRKRFITIC